MTLAEGVDGSEEMLLHVAAPGPQFGRAEEATQATPIRPLAEQGSWRPPRSDADVDPMPCTLADLEARTAALTQLVVFAYREGLPLPGM